MMSKVHVQKDDLVVVISGKSNYKNAKNYKELKEKNKTGKDLYKPAKVLAVSPEEGKVIVEGKNFVTKHVKPKRQGEAGGIVKAEAAMYASKVMHYCEKCEMPVKLGVKIEEDGSKTRVCRKCGTEIGKYGRR